jgi:hypothetical protein
MVRKRLVITLPSDAYQRLAHLAEQEERVIDQQASLLLKRLLTRTVSVATSVVDGPSDRHQLSDIQVNGQEHAAEEDSPRSVMDGRDGGIS